MSLILLTNDAGDVHRAYDSETLELLVVKHGAVGEYEVLGPAIQVTKPHIDIAEEMQSAPIDVAAAATEAVLNAPGPGKAIWVYGWVTTFAAAATYVWLSALHPRSGTMNAGANGGSCPGGGRYPLFKCGTNEALNLTTAGAGGTGDGILQYRIVGA